MACDGAYAEYMALPARNVVAIPQDVGDVDAAPADPVDVADGPERVGGPRGRPQLSSPSVRFRTLAGILDDFGAVLSEHRGVELDGQIGAAEAPVVVMDLKYPHAFSPSLSIGRSRPGPGT